MAYTGLELAAGGGAIFLMENITPRLIVSTIMIFGGIALTISGHASLSSNKQKTEKDKILLSAFICV